MDADGIGGLAAEVENIVQSSIDDADTGSTPEEPTVPDGAPPQETAGKCQDDFDSYINTQGDIGLGLGIGGFVADGVGLVAEAVASVIPQWCSSDRRS